MTSEGRLARGKANYEYKNRHGERVGRFLDNPETVDYINTLEKPKETKEAKDAKPTK